MALKGSLEDFSIVNILQMIKLEGKIGKLLLADKDEEVKITFDKGMIIYGEGSPARDEARIEHTLLSNGLIRPEDWKGVKKEHEESLKPYWDLLSKRLDVKLLAELINRQTVDTVYFGLRWVKGTYEFSPVKNMRYNEKVMIPRDVDGILMEGCRIADEWARVAASIPPFDTFIVKNILGDGDEQDAPPSTTATAKREEAPKSFKESLEFEVLSARGVTIKDSHISVLSVIGAGKTIQEIMYSARQGSFNTIEALSALLNMGVVKAVKKKGKTLMAVDHSGTGVAMAVAAALAAIVGMGGFMQLAGAQGGQAKSESVAAVRNEEAKYGLRKVERALKIYMVIRDDLPRSVDDLVSAGVLSAADSVDPWENKYVLESGADSVSLYSHGPDAASPADNIYLTPIG
jgi:hypothetical protein